MLWRHAAAYSALEALCRHAHESCGGCPTCLPSWPLVLAAMLSSQGGGNRGAGPQAPPRLRRVAVRTGSSSSGRTCQARSPEQAACTHVCLLLFVTAPPKSTPLVVRMSQAMHTPMMGVHLVCCTSAQARAQGLYNICLQPGVQVSTTGS